MKSYLFAILSIAVISTMIFSISSCYYDIQEELHSGFVICDTTLATYSNRVNTVLRTNCTICHSATNPSGGINLETYAGIQAVAQNGKLLGSVEQVAGFKPMPPNSGKLSECDIKTLRVWVNSGSLNN